MSDDRVISKRASNGVRVCSLNDFEFRVWMQYQLSADDFGVMPFSAATVRGDNRRLAKEPERKVAKALDRILDVKLVRVFDDHGTEYCWQVDWQDFQRVEFPRRTTRPKPSPESITLGTPITAYLFSFYPGGIGKVPGMKSEEFQAFARDRARANTHTNTHTNGDGGVGEEPPKYAGNPHHNPGNLINGADLRRHGQHAWCSLSAGRDGLCVPWFLQQEFVGKLGGEASREGELLAWYPTVLAKYAGRPIGDDGLKFWRNEFAGWVGTVTSAPASRPTARGNTTVDSTKYVGITEEG